MARNVIVLDRMFSGSYLEENIGHEIINLYQSDNGDQSDNGENYIYLSPDGNFDAKYKDRIAYVILTQDNGTNQDKVVGLAEIDCDVYQHGDTILKQINYIVKHNVKYGGTYAHIPFMANKSQQDIIIDFKAKALYQPTKEIIIDYSAKRNTINNKGVLVVSVGGLLKKSRKSLKQYVEPSEDNHNPAYDVLAKFIKDAKLWKKTPNLIKKGKINSPEANKIVMINKFSEAVEKGEVINKYFG